VTQGGYAVVRAEPIRKRKHECGAHRGGKRRGRVGANPARATALRHSRPMHGAQALWRGEEGVPMSFGDL
jgi:hypothetical protein